MLLDQPVQGSEGSFVFRPIRQKSKFWKVNVSPFFRLPNKKGRRTPDRRLKPPDSSYLRDSTVGAIHSNKIFGNSVQNSMDRFVPTGKVSNKLVHLKRWATFPGRTGWNFWWMARAPWLLCQKLHCVQYVAQYPDGTSIRTLKTKTPFLRRSFQLSVNEVFRMKAEHFSFKMKVLASWKLAKQSQKTPFCSGE